MKAILAVALVAVGLAVALFVWLRWSVPAEMTPVTVRFEASKRAAVENVQFTVSGLEFLQAQASEDDVRPLGVIRRGDQSAELPEVTEFHFVREEGRTIWAVAESTTEGPGPSVLVLRSDDRVNFTAWELKKPTYLGVVDGFEVQGDSVVLRCSGDPRLFLTEDWWWELVLALPSAIRPLSSADTFSFRTRDGGKTWRLSR
ncbi:MAG: hypothetical protein ACO1OB_21700 [Archangium sp.]